MLHLPNINIPQYQLNSCAITSLEPVAFLPGYYVVMAYLTSHALCFDGIGLVLVPGFTGAKAGTMEEDR